MKTKQIILHAHPVGMPQITDFKHKEIELGVPQKGSVILKSLYISVDPYMRGRMTDKHSYIAPYKLGKPLTGGVIAEVVDPNDTLFKKGDVVFGLLPWATYAIAPAAELKKIKSKEFPYSYYLGVLGMPGLAAYFGVIDICKPKAGKTLVVSGAAGAVGIIVGQIAKNLGAYVVGITGSDDKATLLKEEYHFDAIINYKTETDLSKAIENACPNGVDCYFDNVGGDITDAVIANINTNARIALCGQISLYNEETIPVGWRMLPQILTHSALIKGFIVWDYNSKFPEALIDLMHWVKDGKLKYTETIVEGFDQLPSAFIGLFAGANTGKMIVKIV